MLAPDLVVMCDEENRREDADALQTAGLRVHSCSPRSVSDVAPALRALADAVGVDGIEMGRNLAVADEDPLGLAAFVPIWRRPWMLAPSEPYPFGERHVEELSSVAPVLLVDGRDLFWWGVRTPDAIDRLRTRISEVM